MTFVKTDFLDICPRCRFDFKVKVSEDIGFWFHWVENFYCIDVDLLIEEANCVVWLFSMVYVLKRARA